MMMMMLLKTMMRLMKKSISMMVRDLGSIQMMENETFWLTPPPPQKSSYFGLLAPGPLSWLT